MRSDAAQDPEIGGLAITSGDATDERVAFELVDRAPVVTGRTLCGRGPTAPGAARLHVGCVPDLPLQRLQSFLGALHAHAPRLCSEVTHLSSVEQLERLRAGALDLAVVHDARDGEAIETQPLFAGESMAAFLPTGHRLAGRPTLGPDDLRDEVLLTSPRAADPVLHDRIAATLDSAGYRFGAVHETNGSDLRDVLLAVAEGRGIALGSLSGARVVGELGAVLIRRALEPAQWMPETRIAWSAGAALTEGVAAARAAARRLRGR
jgi:hypothetical protein